MKHCPDARLHQPNGNGNPEVLVACEPMMGSDARLIRRRTEGAELEGRGR